MLVSIWCRAAQGTAINSKRSLPKTRITVAKIKRFPHSLNVALFVFHWISNWRQVNDDDDLCRVCVYSTAMTTTTTTGHWSFVGLMQSRHSSCRVRLDGASYNGVQSQQLDEESTEKRIRRMPPCRYDCTSRRHRLLLFLNSRSTTRIDCLLTPYITGEGRRWGGVEWGESLSN